MREIAVITKDLTTAAEDAAKKKKAHDDAGLALQNAGVAYTEAQNAVSKLQLELKEALETLMPGFTNSNVRQS